MSTLLVSAGEASGDRAAARVALNLRGHRIVGLGGAALESVGAELVADLRHSTAMGLFEVVSRSRSIAGSYRSVLRAAARERPKAALLVNYSEFNQRLARALRKRKIPSVWYGAPQVWAWRPKRARALAEHLSHMAVMLPFEAQIWTRAGVPTTYVGHPALEDERLVRDDARRRVGLTPWATGVALLPGSRPHEVRRLLPPMLEAWKLLRQRYGSVDARLFLAPSLGPDLQQQMREAARQVAVPSLEVDPLRGLTPFLSAFDVAFTASGTATLECALAGVLPVIVYRMHPLTALAARAFVRTAHIGLPNILLDRSAFPEIMQRDVTGDRLAREARRLIEDREAGLRDCAEVRERLGGPARPSEAVASILRVWLER